MAWLPGQQGSILSSLKTKQQQKESTRVANRYGHFYTGTEDFCVDIFKHLEMTTFVEKIKPHENLTHY